MNVTERLDPANVKTVYQELCDSYHGIDDFRAKLLRQIPVFEQSPIILAAVGVFGFPVTVGLFTYELRGIQLWNGLIEAGMALEDELGIQGQVRLRPAAVNSMIVERCRLVVCGFGK